MSHFDDIDFVFWGDWPSTGCGTLIFLVIAAAAIGWAVMADSSSKDLCAKHGETYVDSRAGYTLCEADGGAVVRRDSEKP